MERILMTEPLDASDKCLKAWINAGPLTVQQIVANSNIDSYYFEVNDIEIMKTKENIHTENEMVWRYNVGMMDKHSQAKNGICRRVILQKGALKKFGLII